VAVAGFLAGCVSTSGGPTAGVAPASSPSSTASLPVVAPRHVLSSECAYTSAAECRRIHAEGIRLMLASCPQNDASCARVRVVSAKRVNARTAEITVRDGNGKRSVRRVPVAMSTAPVPVH